MTELADPTVLVDPTQAFLAQDPTVLREVPAAPPTADPRQKRIALELAAAVVAITALVRHRLAQAGPQPDPYPDQARNAWKELAPTWLRLAVPAVRQAYALGRVEGLTGAELDMLATDYADKLGDYINETSADALNAGMEQQLSQRWSERVAWHRATAAYGLDKRDMRSWLTGMLSGDRQGPDLIPLAARTAVDRAMLARADRIGANESYAAQQSGQVMAWIWLARQGRLPAGCGRAWEMGANETHCATCAELAGQVVPLEEPFVLVGGAKLWAPRAHPGCYCRIRLVRPEIEKREIRKVLTVKAAGIAVQAKDTGRVLMLQRAIDPKDPASGTWEFPGGTLEPGELPQAAAEREWAEEVHQRLPVGSWAGSWRNGVYVGFRYLVASEDLVPVHRRGRVRNPDDPDGDEIEAFAWWDLKHLSRNPAVRGELRRSLGKVAPLLAPISKADGDYWNVRDRSGRFAHVAEAKAAEKLDLDLTETKDPFAAASPFSGRADPFAGTIDPFAAKDPFAAPAKDPFAKDPFASDPFAPKSALRRVRRHHVVLFAPELPTPPAPDAYYLPVDDFHSLTALADIGNRYGASESLNFDDAASTPYAIAGDPWSMLGEDHVLTADRVSDPVRMSEDLQGLWQHVLPTAKDVWDTAMDDADEIVPRLSDGDAHRIARLAGYEDHEDANSLRDRIARHVAGRDQGKDDSLAMAYADYVTWHSATEYLGEDGRELDARIDAVGDSGLNLRTFSGDPIPTEQVFAFDSGFHPGTQHGEQEARVTGEYATQGHTYRSALHDLGMGAPPLHIGLKVTRAVPFVAGQTGSRKGEIIEG